MIKYHPKFKDYKVRSNVALKGRYGDKYKIDFLLIRETKGNQVNDVIIINGIIVKDWKRSLSYSVVFDIEKMIKNVPIIKKIILITNSFSQEAIYWARRCNILTLTAGEIISIYNIYWKDIQKAIELEKTSKLSFTSEQLINDNCCSELALL